MFCLSKLASLQQQGLLGHRSSFSRLLWNCGPFGPAKRCDPFGSTLHPYVSRVDIQKERTMEAYGETIKTFYARNSTLAPGGAVESEKSPKVYPYVVVGGGNSAGYLAKAFAEQGKGGELLVVAEEAVLPYERPALTKGVLFPEKPARLPGFHTSVGGGGERQTAEWYAEKGVAVHLGARVAAADLAARTLTTADGQVVGYGTLVVATGCGAVRLPPAIGGSLPGVSYVRSYADALQLYEALQSAKKVVVIGGGYIGLEVAAAACAWGVPTDVVMLESHVLSRLWTPEIAAAYEAHYESRGATFHRQTKLLRILGSGPDGTGAVTGVEVEGGAVLEADLVVVGIGSTCPLGPFAGLDTTEERFPGGIKTDEHFRASGPGVPAGSVYAIGDIAAFPLALEGGKLVRMEHVDHARKSAAHAAAHMLAGAEAAAPYDYMPYFYSRTFEHAGSERKLAWVFYGLQRGQVVVVGDFQPKLAAFWVEEGKVFGVMLESGSPEEVAALPAVARAQLAVDVAALQAAPTVEAALALVGVGS